MKNALVDELCHLATTDPRVILINAVGDDAMLFQKFAATQPERLFGQWEDLATPMGIAAGLASAGLKPIFIASAASLGSTCLQQIRFQICYHHMPVVLVGVEAGMAGISKGEAQLSLQDLAFMRAVPGLRVLAPADSMELRSCLRAAIGENGPTYIRLDTHSESAFFPERPIFSFGVWKQVRQGSRVTILATGSMLPAAIKAADILEQTSLCPRICSCASIKPLDTAALLRYFSRDELVVTIEEHSRAGGFGSAVAEWLSDNLGRQHARLLRIGADDEFLNPHADQAHAREATSLSPSAIAATICSYMESHR